MIKALIILAICIFEIAAMWKVFTKMGTAGWKSIIPIYNMYEQINYTCNSLKLFWATVVLGLVEGIVEAIAAGSTIGLIFSAIVGLAGLYVTVKTYMGLAKSFGKGTGYAILLLLFGVIMIPILGFGDAQYVGRSDVDLF